MKSWKRIGKKNETNREKVGGDNHSPFYKILSCWDSICLLSALIIGFQLSRRVEPILESDVIPSQ